MSITNGEVLVQLHIIENTILQLKRQLTGITDTGWQSSKNFMQENGFSRTRLNTLIAQGKVEFRKVTPRYYEYRWVAKKTA